MVLNGGCYRNLANPQISHVDVTNSPSMAGKAVLICRPNSHPFVVRTLILEQPVKIGRSVARSRASQSNGIFDCKVLSRNHALIWYNNGKFYLQDTKSSNGTFVNNQRLSKSGEESQPREVSSGDIVQFGVDVLENARKVTHGCIVANLKLYLPDGKEAKASPSTSVLSGGYKISIEDLYQLNIHIQDALQREQLLETKLAALEKLVSSLRDAADTGWKALIAEDRLLSRVEILENQLQTYAKNFPEDKLREELRKLQEDKNVYQGLAKDCLQKALQEKLEAVHKCHDIERVLMNTEAECANLKFEMMRDRDELQELAVKHNNQFLKSIKLQDKLEDAEEQHKEALARLEAENEELSSEVKRLLANEAVMHEKIQQLETSGEIVGRQLLGIQSQFQIRKSPEILDMSLLKERNGIATDVICKNNDEDFDNEKQMNDSNVDTIVSRLMLSVEDHKRSKEFVELMEAQVSLLQSEKMAKLQQINSLEGELEVHDDKVCKYKEELKKLEQSLVTLEQRLKDETNKLEASIIAPLVTDTSRSSSSERLSNGPQPVNIESLQTQINDLKEAIKEVRGKMEEMEETIDLRQADLNSAKKALTEITKNWILQDEKFQEAQTMRKESEATVTLLGEQLKALESSFLQSKIQEKVDEESEHINKHKEEATLLRKQLMETQQAAKQNRNETELVREKLRTVMEELEAAKAALTECQPDNRTSEELAELSAAKQEAASLHDQVVSLEFLVKKLKEENNQKQSEPVQTSFTGTIILEENEEITEKLRLRVSEMEDELVLVKEKYVACNEKNTQLEKEIFSLRQDYEAIVHQPYFNVVFVLPLIVLFIAMTIFFHPTLAPLMGTFDNSLPNS